MISLNYAGVRIGVCLSLPGIAAFANEILGCILSDCVDPGGKARSAGEPIQALPYSHVDLLLEILPAMARIAVFSQDADPLRAVSHDLLNDLLLFTGIDHRLAPVQLTSEYLVP